MTSPNPNPGTNTPNPSSQRSAQVALAVCLVVLLGLLAFRGYGNRLGARPTESASPARIDLNRADRTELQQIPKIGPKLAEAIDTHRTANGPFNSVEELGQVRGIGPQTLDTVRPYLRVEPGAPPATDPPIPHRSQYRPTPPASQPPAWGSRVQKLQPGDPPIDVNAASEDELLRLPGVGAVTARNIIAARADRPFRSVDDLDRVKGIGPKTLDKFRPFVVVR